MYVKIPYEIATVEMTTITFLNDYLSYSDQFYSKEAANCYDIM